jgi:toxin ParE1/3/4
MSPVKVILGRHIPNDLDIISEYLNENDPPSAVRFSQAVPATLEDLLQFPGAGSPKDPESTGWPDIRSWRVKGFPKYLIFYRYLRDEVHVLAILHGARDVFAILKSRR